jgi:hypothetical protein
MVFKLFAYFGYDKLRLSAFSLWQFRRLQGRPSPNIFLARMAA